VGQNGVGKTTLLNRIHAGDINGFPRDLPRYFIEHEAQPVARLASL
jgi:ABC-type molybdenum transport system ATPase subunit/photorepair protein PhrA